MPNTYANFSDRRHPVKLFLEVTARCNAHRQSGIRQITGCDTDRKDLTDATFAALKPAIAHLDEVIIGGRGEPLLHPRLESMICDIKAMLPSSGSVGLQSNGTLLTRHRIKELFSVGLDTICVSADAANAGLGNSIPAEAQAAQLESTLGLLTAAIGQSRCCAPMVGVQITLMHEKMRLLPQLLKWADRLGIDFVIVSNGLPLDDRQPGLAAYPSVSDADIVSGSQEDAIFEEAMCLAQSLGLDLVLPAGRPFRPRHCSFIEEGSVFVAWDGSVSACHFTWQSYSPYPLGNRRQRQPVCFGHLDTRPLIDIWNSPEFRVFRKSVRRLYCPPGSNSGIASGANVYGHESEVDGCSLPCRECPWPTGRLNCLQ